MIKEFFEKVEPEKVGLNSYNLEKIIEFLTSEKKLDIHSFLVIKHGYLIFEKYFRDNERETPHVMYSVSKSFTSIAIGILYDEKMLKLDDPIIDFFPEHKYLIDHEYKNEITIRHLLTMSAGLSVNEGESFDSFDLAKFYFLSPVKYKPGTHFEYSSAATYILSAIVSKITKKSLHEFLIERVFKPLNIMITGWLSCPKGISMGGYGLFICAYDMAKFAQMLLNNGSFKGMRIVSKEWIDLATTKQIETFGNDNKDIDWQAGYGFQFWRCSFNAYRADGMKGQYIVVIPEKNMSLIITSCIEKMQIPLDGIKKYLI